MSVLKAVGLFLVWLVIVVQTSAFLQDKYTGLDTSDNTADLTDVFQTAKTVYSFVQRNPELARQGIAVIKANAVVAGVSVYSGGILVSAYYLFNDAKKRLMESQFEHDDLDMIIETEILPALKLFYSTNKMKRFCSTWNDIFDKAIDSLRKERKIIEKRMIESTTGETRSKILKYISGGVGTSSAVGTAAACLTTGPACPIIAGPVVAISSWIGYYVYGESQSTYRESFEVLVLAREKALNAENMLRKAKAVMIIQNCIWFLMTLTFRIP